MRYSASEKFEIIRQNIHEDAQLNLNSTFLDPVVCGRPTSIKTASKIEQLSPYNSAV